MNTGYRWLAVSSMILATVWGSSGFASSHCSDLQGHWSLKSTDNPYFTFLCQTPLWEFTNLDIRADQCEQLDISWIRKVGPFDSHSATIQVGAHQQLDVEYGTMTLDIDSAWKDSNQKLSLFFDALNHRDQTGVKEGMELSRAGDLLIVESVATKSGSWKPGPVPFPLHIRCEFARQ